MGWDQKAGTACQAVGPWAACLASAPPRHAHQLGDSSTLRSTQAHSHHAGHHSPTVLEQAVARQPCKLVSELGFRLGSQPLGHCSPGPWPKAVTAECHGASGVQEQLSSELQACEGEAPGPGTCVHSRTALPVLAQPSPAGWALGLRDKQK